MFKRLFTRPAIAGLLFCSPFLAAAQGLGAVIEEDFSTDPAERGWRVHGAEELFRWDPAMQHISARWDSSMSNTYYYRPLGTILTREDDFQLRFELRLLDVEVGLREEKPFTFQVAVSLLNLREATRPGFLRGTAEASPDLVEFNYFPDSGFGATISTILISSDNQFAPGFNFPFELTPGDLFRVEMSYSAREQTLETRMFRNGETFGPIRDVKLGEGFTDFRLDAVAISSYSDEGADGSLLAAGAVDNLTLVLPEPPIRGLTGGFSAGAWVAQFTGLPGWSYTLERSEDLRDWQEASSKVAGGGDSQHIEDLSPPRGNGSVFYRLRAER
jgi:hypothetical protein